MPPLKTYTFKYKTRPAIVLTLQAYSEEDAWLELGELVYMVKKWELSK